jgi:hypothetical protein
VPGLTIASTSGKRLELDFAMLWQSSSPYVDPTRLIVGECKTFGTFERADVNRMREAAALFPGAFLVFACLRDTLTPAEKTIIRPLAVKGRKNNWRNPVIVLTERELSGDWEPPTCWRSSADKVVADQCPAIMTLTGLADATQQLRLGLPPGDGWPHPQWHEREAAARKVAGIS